MCKEVSLETKLVRAITMAKVTKILKQLLDDCATGWLEFTLTSSRFMMLWGFLGWISCAKFLWVWISDSGLADWGGDTGIPVTILVTVCAAVTWESHFSDHLERSWQCSEAAGPSVRVDLERAYNCVLWGVRVLRENGAPGSLSYSVPVQPSQKHGSHCQ